MTEVANGEENCFGHSYRHRSLGVTTAPSSSMAAPASGNVINQAPSNGSPVTKVAVPMAQARFMARLLESSLRPISGTSRNNLGDQNVSHQRQLLLHEMF